MDQTYKPFVNILPNAFIECIMSPNAFIECVMSVATHAIQHKNHQSAPQAYALNEEDHAN
jgi:hypothetical protein